MSLNDEYRKYQQGVNEALSHITFSHARYVSGGYKYPENIRKFISKSAVVEIFISWESFLEGAFLEFLNGEPSATGHLLTRYAMPLNIEHGRNIASGTKPFVEWGNPEIVRQIAKLYFLNGEPFSTVIGAVYTDLLDMKTIRNASAHITSTTQAKLDATASRWLSRTVANIEVYDFVFSMVPSTTPPQTVLMKLVSVLNAAAYNIAYC